MANIVIYTPQKSDRLAYVLDWIFKERLQVTYELVHDEILVTSLPFFISYGKQFANAISIPDAGLLWETGVAQQNIAMGEWNNIPTLYAQQDGSTIPFDIFSAIFFLLSRYEEYYAFIPDKHGRYPATESILYKQGILRRPIIDEWLQQLKNIIKERAAIELPDGEFKYQPTYDIDIAYSYKYKGPVRTAGAYIRDLLKGNLQQIGERKRVLQGRQQDPYDSFQWLRELHKKNQIKPIYFTLTALDTTAFDKNINPANVHMQTLNKQLAAEGSIGIHPSYYADKEETFIKEKQTLEKIIARPINISRQHYIKLKLPDTYRILKANGITDDYSMGYGSHIGFRAGTGSSFLWYDLQNEKTTTLRVYPFCFMDSTAHYEETLGVAAAFEALNKMRDAIQNTRSTLITVFHNFSLGSSKEWNGWSEAYATLVDAK